MRLIDADELIKCIPSEEYNSRFAVMNAPTVEPQKWIPCTPETMPEENDEVLVTGKVDNALYVDIDEWTGSGFWINAFGVIAWMPLPEPYKGGEE